jgi:RNA polymerase sigma factor (sigma-70 family)
MDGPDPARVTIDPPNRAPHLSLVTNQAEPARAGGAGEDPASGMTRDVDWSILMARAQGGDGASYRRLLDSVTPYLRSLATPYHREPSDVEDAVQDVLLTVHSIRATYDPARPFGPWLLAIANRRLADRLRRQGRRRLRETPLLEEHEFLAGTAANAEALCDHAKLETAIGRLSHGQQRAIRLLKLREMPLKEAAMASGMSVTSLKVSVHRALVSLRKMLTNRSDT